MEEEKLKDLAKSIFEKIEKKYQKTAKEMMIALARYENGNCHFP